MKKLLATALAGAAVAVAANGQGTVNFANYFTGTTSDPIVYMSDGTTRVQGGQFTVALFGGASAGTMAQIATTTFLGQGYFVGPTVSIPGVAGGTLGTFQIEVWDTTLGGTATGATFAEAFSYGNAGHANVYGLSTIFTNPTGDPSATPPGLPKDLTNMQTFNLNPVPEPTTFALAGLAAASGLIFRRRK